MPTGLVIIVAVLMALDVAANPAEAGRCPMRAAGPDPWPGGCGRGSGDTMNTFTAKDLGAADLLALARLDDDGAPCSGGRRVRSLPAHYRT
jgi:hypothetical protein